MRTTTRVARPIMPPAPTATYIVKFEQRPKRAPRRERPRPLGRMPRVARLLALAHRIDGMIRSGEIRNWAEAARLVGVTRARMTQIANLLLLAPDVQEAILNLPHVVKGQDQITEHALRSIASHSDWQEQAQGRLPGEAVRVTIHDAGTGMLSRKPM